jgi:hypothetical protein
MYLYMRTGAETFWSQQAPTQADLKLIDEHMLCVYSNFGGTFVQLDVVDGKLIYADVSKGRRARKVETGEVFTLHEGEFDTILKCGRWEVVPPPIPIGPPGMKSPP